MFAQLYHSPIGAIQVIAGQEGIRKISFHPAELDAQPNEHTKEAVAQLTQYFQGKLQTFTLPLSLDGTAFQQQVWQQLLQVPFGTTITYAQQANQLGNAKVIRASANANGKNPIAIVLPCHRVVGANGKLTGYAGALWRKQWLLAHEAKCMGTYQLLF
jgi:methylated-DNA-[protein]-cysteine S-methyltransferase